MDVHNYLKSQNPETETLYLQDRDETETFNLQDRDETESPRRSKKRLESRDRLARDRDVQDRDYIPVLSCNPVNPFYTHHQLHQHQVADMTS